MMTSAAQGGADASAGSGIWALHLLARRAAVRSHSGANSHSSYRAARELFSGLVTLCSSAPDTPTNECRTCDAFTECTVKPFMPSANLQARHSR